MRLKLKQILKENKISQVDLLTEIQKRFSYPVQKDRLSVICRSDISDIKVSTIIQIIKGLEALGVKVTPNDLIQY